MPTPAHILSVATAVPEHAVSTDDVKQYFPKAFDLDERRLTGIYAVIDHARIRTRHFLFPLEYTIQQRPLDVISSEYRTAMITLGRQVAEDALAEANLTPTDIDLIITVSCTGFMIPSLESHLVNLMGFRPDVKRLPITELGCAAGAAALGRATDYARAYPEQNVLVIAVDLPSLTLQTKDLTPANLISCCLFGDGAAGVVLCGKPAAKAHQTPLRILDVQSHILPDSLEAMGFDLRSTGLHIFLSKNVPQFVKENIVDVVGQLLTRNRITRENLEFFLLHPGGQKLLNFVEEKLALAERDTACSWNVLADYGNMSAVTIFFVIKEFLATITPRHGALGLLAGFGPGFSTELALLQYE